MKRLVYILVLGLMVLFTFSLYGCEKRSERASQGISEEEYEQQREARIQARNKRIIEKNEKAREEFAKRKAEESARRAARKAANKNTDTSGYFGSILHEGPPGVTTIGFLNWKEDLLVRYWQAGVMTKLSNSGIHRPVNI